MVSQRIGSIDEPQKPVKRAANGASRKFYDEVVLTYTADECLIWPFARWKATGYASMRVGKRRRVVSRLACTEVHGEPPTPDHEAAHTCGKGHLGCVNPNHLRWKTTTENHADKHIHGTMPLGEACGNSKLTEDQVRIIRSLIGTTTKRAIADRFGVVPMTITNIETGLTWGWLK